MTDCRGGLDDISGSEPDKTDNEREGNGEEYGEEIEGEGKRNRKEFFSEEERRARSEFESEYRQPGTINLYATYVGEFVIYVMKRGKELIEEEIVEEIERESEERNRRKIVRKYYKLLGSGKHVIIKDYSRIPEFYTYWMMETVESEKGMKMSPSCYRNRMSAIHSMYIMSKKGEKETGIFEETSRRLGRIIMKKIANAAQKGIISVKRGKDPLRYREYCELGKILLESERDELFGHAVLTTMWNLMSRVENAVKICRRHIEYKGDSLLFFFGHEKTDHEMRKPGNPRHVYANPYEPAICPILSLGLYFIDVDISSKAEEESIFPGESQDERFNGILKRAMKGHEEEGGVYSNIGSHSIRKGAATYVSSGTTSSPSQFAINNRGGWTQGVPGIYFQYEGAGDEYIGRILSGLNVNDVSFGVLPPMFKEEEGNERIIEEILKDCYVNYERMSEEFQRVLKVTTASVIYHMDTLKERFFKDGHPILLKRIFSKTYEKPIRELVEIREWKEGEGIKASGIPPHISIMKELKGYKESNEKMKREMKRMKSEIERMEGMMEEMMRIMKGRREEEEEYIDETGRIEEGIEEEEEEEEEEEGIEEEGMEEESLGCIGISRGEGNIGRMNGIGKRGGIESYFEPINVGVNSREISGRNDVEVSRVSRGNIIGRGRRCRIGSVNGRMEGIEERMKEIEKMVKGMKRNREEGNEGTGGRATVRIRNGKLTIVPEDFVMPDGKMRDMWIRYFFGYRGIPALGMINVEEVEIVEEGKKLIEFKGLIVAIIREGEKQGIMKGKPEDEFSAGRLFDSIDMSNIIGERSKKRVSIGNLSWNYVRNLYYKKKREDEAKKQKNREDESI